MVKLSTEIKFFESRNGVYENLLPFAFQAAHLFDKEFTTSLDIISTDEKSEIKEKEEERDRTEEKRLVIRKIGSKKKGFVVTWEVNEQKKGRRVSRSDDTIELKAYGLPKNNLFIINNYRDNSSSWQNRTLRINVSGPEITSKRIIELFRCYFKIVAYWQKKMYADECIRRAKKYLQEEEWIEVIKFGYHALRYDPYEDEESDANFLIGVANVSLGLVALAKIYLQKTIDDVPDHYDAWYNLGLAHEAREELDDALTCYETAAANAPTNHAFLYKLGTILKDLRKNDDAVQALLYTIRVKPKKKYGGVDYTEKAKKLLDELNHPWTGNEKLTPISKWERLKSKKDSITEKKKIKEEEEETRWKQEGLNSSLIRGAEDKNFAKVKQALADGADVDAKTSRGRTALIYACDYNASPQIAKFLIDNGADLDAQEEDRETALTYASMYGRISIVKYLIDAGADVNKKGGYGRTPLHFASTPGNWSDHYLEIVKLLLEHRADPNALNSGGDNPLMELIWCDKFDLEIARLLIDYGTDLEYVGSFDKTALMRAADKGLLELVKIINEKIKKSKNTSEELKSALLEAFGEDNKDVVMYLLEQGADFREKTTFGDNVLAYAAEHGHIDIIEWLINHVLDLVEEIKETNYALRGAAYKGELEVVKFLINKGAYVNGGVSGGQENPLMNAARYNYIKMAEFLVEKGADLESTNFDGNTPLQFAAYEGKIKMVKFLLEKGANINAKNKTNWNALMQAALEGFEEVAKILIEKGSEVDVIGIEKGGTALMLAALKASEKTVKLLLDNGADKTIKDKKGRTALDYAEKYYNKEIIELLED